ncbi:hypothetical protein [uncultured Desulfobacter sp.]|uniref:hypothetical protein n=1 Tax=uncultured Desulfobacter sp. TaxID=240139 RepID=UPI0029F561BC|nr:hypothetical protein [uncultured Desulfobacter sp.]
MSDTILEEDDLISQEDIDSLLNDSGPDEEDSNIEEEDAGELSQDDIDSLMTDNVMDDEAPEDDAGELSQDDIDSLLNGPDQDDDDSDNGEEDAGELSQDDIDSMMTDNAIDDEAPEEDAGELSQDDIDSLLNGPDQDDDDSDNAMDDDELISLEDIQGAMSDDDTQENDVLDSEPVSAAETEPEPEALDPESTMDNMTEQIQEDEDEAVDDAPVTEALGRDEDPLDDPIDEDQAADAADCMLTQEAMDALIEAGLPVQDDPEGDTGERQADDGEDEDDTLLDEIEQTSETDDGWEDDAVQEQEDDVTQEDIDALLQQSDETDDFLDEDEDILISQDDINTLLMAADQEDEDLLGDIEGDDDVSDPADQSQDLKPDADQVVLEGIEGAEISVPKEASAEDASKKGGKIKALFKSKIVLAAASVLLFMGISVPLSYFLFFSNEPVPLPEKQTASLTEIDLIRDGQTNISGDGAILPPSRRSGTILLTDFIILASDQSRTMTYVYADVSIDYSDQRAYDEINSNLAFYRDLIYGAIQTRLVSENNHEVTEADLLWGVETSLKKVLPPQYIDKISFKSFKAT